MLVQFNMRINLWVLDALLRNLLHQVIIKTRSGVLLVTLLIPADFFSFASLVEESCGAWALGNSFSFIM